MLHRHWEEYYIDCTLKLNVVRWGKAYDLQLSRYHCCYSPVVIIEANCLISTLIND